MTYRERVDKYGLPAVLVLYVALMFVLAFVEMATDDEEAALTVAGVVERASKATTCHIIFPVLMVFPGMVVVAIIKKDSWWHAMKRVAFWILVSLVLVEIVMVLFVSALHVTESMLVNTLEKLEQLSGEDAPPSRQDEAPESNEGARADEDPSRDRDDP